MSYAFAVMSSSNVIVHYETLGAITGQMIDAARQGNWDNLIAIEKQRSALVAKIKTLDATTQLDETARQRKKALIEVALVQDAEIRTLVQAWMSEHELSMQSNAQELRLLRKYGA